jgi:hypothetical protein
MLDLLGSTVGMMAIATNLVAIACVLPGSLARRLSLAAIAGGWVGLAAGLGAAGSCVLSQPPRAARGRVVRAIGHRRCARAPISKSALDADGHSMPV